MYRRCRVTCGALRYSSWTALKTIGFAARAQDPFLLVGPRFVDQALGLAAGLGDHLLGVAPRLEFDSRALLLGAGDIRERILHRVGRFDVLELYALEFDAGAVFVENRTDPLQGLGLDRLLAPGEQGVDRHFRDHRAHLRRRDGFDGPARVAQVEQEVAQVADPVTHDEFHVDQVLVDRDHPPLVGHIGVVHLGPLDLRGSRRRLSPEAELEIDRVGHGTLLVLLHERNVKLEGARTQRAVVVAQAHHHRLLVRRNAERAEPRQESDCGHEQREKEFHALALGLTTVRLQTRLGRVAAAQDRFDQIHRQGE